MRSARSGSSRPSSPFTRAAAALMRPNQWTTSSWTGSPETGKFSTALIVSGPHSCCFPSCTAMRVVSPGRSAFPYTLAEEGRELSAQADGVVVGHEEAGPRQHAQLGLGEPLERLLGHAEGMHAVLVGPQ